MASTTLTNPLDRLSVLPNTMNWRGKWDNDTQYYLNDIVVSPSINASYILVGEKVLKGGEDPALSQSGDWEEFSSTSTGVQSVTTLLDSGIIVTGTTNVQITNDGVISIGEGTGISITGDPHFPVITNTGITSIVGTAGIKVTPILQLGSPSFTAISNTGVLGVSTQPNSGLTITGDPQQPVITNTGVLTVAAGNAGITVNSSSGNVTITNNGINSVDVVPSSGLALTGTATAPILANTGVISVTSLVGSGITVDNTNPQNPKISAIVPQLSYVAAYTSVTIVPQIIEIPSTLSIQYYSMVINFTNAAGTLWEYLFANGPPPTLPDATFMLDLTRYVITAAGFAGVDTYYNCTVSLEDRARSAKFIIGTIANAGLNTATVPALCIGTFPISIVAARGTGIVIPSNILLEFELSAQQQSFLSCVNLSDIYALYYPLGVYGGGV